VLPYVRDLIDRRLPIVIGKLAKARGCQDHTTSSSADGAVRPAHAPASGAFRRTFVTTPRPLLATGRLTSMYSEKRFFHEKKKRAIPIDIV